MTKTRTHNEYFRPVSLDGRKSCPRCQLKLEGGENIWSWGEYVRAKWRTVAHFCRRCFPNAVRDRLTGHTEACGCEIHLVGYHCKLPAWLTITGVTNNDETVA